MVHIPTLSRTARHSAHFSDCLLVKGELSTTRCTLAVCHANWWCDAVGGYLSCMLHLMRPQRQHAFYL